MIEPTRLKNMLVKMGIFCKDRDEHKKYLKPPPSTFDTSLYPKLFELFSDIFNECCGY